MEKRKHILSMLLFVVSCLFSTYAFAYDAEINGIYYNFNGDEAEVTDNTSYNSYTGDVVIPESVVYNAKTYSVTSIGEKAFYYCKGLTSITIPNSVTSIGGWAFEECWGLKKVIVPDIAAWCGIKFADYSANPLYYAKHLYSEETTEITNLIIPNSVTSIGGWAFLGCTGLTSVTIPNSVTSIGNYAFPECSGLTSVTIPNSVTSIGDGAFSLCSGLTSVTIPNSVTSIGSYAFEECTGLTSVTIPNSVTSIGNYAFRDCYGLTSVTIGSGVLSIGTNAFTSSPKKVIWLTNTPPDGYANLQGSINYVANNLYTSLKNVTVYYPYLSSLFEVEGVKYVPVSPSERTCDAIDCAYNKSAEQIDIGKTVTNRGITLTVRKINPYTCYGNTFLKDTKLHFKGIIGQQAFYGCSAMQTAELGQEITSIGMEAFSACTKLKGIEIPDAVEFLGSYCFENCSSMTFVKMGNGVKTIPIYSFRGCSSLPTIQIPQNVTNIGDYVFDGCTSLETVLMDDGETELTLGSNGSSPLFASCPLDSVYIGRNINYSIASDKGYSPFYRNTKLRSVSITDKETEISPNEFYGCTALKNVRIGDGVTTFGNWAFSGCSNLDFFAFGSSVETIGKEAFSDCSALTKLISRAAIPPVCGTQALDDINKWECTLLVPDGSLILYQTADQWKEFFFTEIDPDGIKGVEAEPSPTSEAEYFDLQGRRIDKAQKGINIIRNADGTTKKVLIKC